MAADTRELTCPNPACSGLPRPVCLYGNAYQVRCNGCGMAGPVAGGRDAAVQAWKHVRLNGSGMAGDRQEEAVEA